MTKITSGPSNFNIMFRIAEAFENSSGKFQFENMKLAKLCDTITAAAPTERIELVSDVWVDFEKDSGAKVAIKPRPDIQGIQLILEDIGASKWFSFSYTLPLNEVRTSRYIGLYIRAISSGFSSFRPCLRYFLEDGSVDNFSKSVVVLSGGEDEQLCFIKVNRELSLRAKGVEMLLFFDGTSFNVALQQIENLHI